jgi:hypothetical protein
MDVQYIRDYCRELLDLEEEDVPDRLIDRWIHQGTLQVQRFVQKWPFYETTNEFPIVAAQVDYQTNFKEIHSIYVDGVGPLDYADEARVANYYHRPDGVRTGKPKHFSLWGTGNITVWPIPDAGYVGKIRGYRKPSGIVTGPEGAAEAGTEPDVPEDFHECVLEWAIYSTYLHQDDIEIGEYHKRAFDALIRQFTADEVSLDPVGPIVLNGGNRQRHRPPWGDPVGPGIGGWGG